VIQNIRADTHNLLHRKMPENILRLISMWSKVKSLTAENFHINSRFSPEDRFFELSGTHFPRRLRLLHSMIISLPFCGPHFVTALRVKVERISAREILFGMCLKLMGTHQFSNFTCPSGEVHWLNVFSSHSAIKDVVCHSLARCE
jgi:tRNA U38,U39,U40 pseudouridine synthase TruA